MIALPASFVSQMRGDLPPVPKGRPLPPYVAPGKRVAEPSASQIALVDEAIASERFARQGVYLRESVLKAYVAETNTAVHQAWKREQKETA